MSPSIKRKPLTINGKRIIQKTNQNKNKNFKITLVSYTLIRRRNVLKVTSDGRGLNKYNGDAIVRVAVFSNTKKVEQFKVQITFDGREQ